MTSRDNTAVLRPTATATREGLIQLDWGLGRVPDPNWVRLLVDSTVPKPPALAAAGLEPSIVGDGVRLTVHDEDLELARAWVEESIRAADDLFGRER